MDLESTIKIEEEIVRAEDCLQDVIKIEEEETLDSHDDEPSLETEDGDLSAIVYIKCEVDDTKLENGSTSDDWTVIENSLKDLNECPLLGTLGSTSQETASFEHVACSSTEIIDNGQNDEEQIIGYNNNSSIAQLKFIETAKGDKFYSCKPSPNQLERVSLVCPVCKKTYKNEVSLKNHLFRIHSAKSLEFRVQQPLQQATEFSKNSKKINLLVIGSNNSIVVKKGENKLIMQKYPCAHCTKTARSPVALTYHVKKFHPSVAEGVYFECQDCDTKFKNYNSMYRHRARFHSGENAKRVQCPQCDATFSTNYNMNHHVKLTHEREKHLTQCSICQKKFSSHSGLKYHMLVHQGTKNFACSQCEMRFTAKMSLKHHTKTIHSKEKPSFQCHECGRLFKTQQNLKRHLQCHNGQCVFTFPCLLCTMWFESSEALEKHQILHAGQKEKKFECQKCNRKYTSQIVLEHHAKWHQEGDVINHVCDVCDATFASHVVMMVHVKKLHAPERPYSCPKCLKEYSNKGSFLDHVKQFHSEKEDGGPNQDGRHHCTKCEKSFGTSRKLARHVKLHYLKRDLKCRFCSKKFKRRHNLNDHERTHSGLKPYSCNECDRTFVTLNALKYHLVLHSKRRPYQCSVCKFRFKCMSHLNGHIKVRKGHENAFAVIIEDDHGETETMKGDQSSGEKDS